MSLIRRAMIYLGLVDDEFDDVYVDEDPFNRSYPQPEPEPPIRAVNDEPTVRPIPIDTPHGVSPVSGAGSGGNVRTVPSTKPKVLTPHDFKDAQEVGDKYKNSQPVIVNLQDADDGLRRRLIDFCSGLTYGLGGTMERVAKNVFLLTPANVEVSPEARRRLQEDGLYNR